MPRLIVVGLGPGGPELTTTGTREVIAAVPIRFLRTERHPAAQVVDGATSFDHVYDTASTLAEVYSTIADELLDAAVVHGEVLYAVPGSPVVAEHTIELLRERSAVAGVDMELYPALSFVDLAWVRLGVDPIAAGVRVIDGQRFSVEAAGERGPLLVAQCDSRNVLSEIKLALDAGVESAVTAESTVTFLHHLGLPDERVITVPWDDLDRSLEPDHLTSLYLPALAQPTAREVERLVDLVTTLRAECPWDQAQTHESLTRHLLEESYEVLDAIAGLDVDVGEGYEALEEELGDLLFQVVFHARLAAEAGQFTLADVADGVYRKLYLRHPHVFGDVAVESPADVVRNWEQIKKAEKGRASVFEGIPDHLPALLFALKIHKKTATLAELGVEVPTAASLTETLQALRGSMVDSDADGLKLDGLKLDETTVGDLLFAVADVARRCDVDPEAALRGAAIRHRGKVMEAEASKAE